MFNMLKYSNKTLLQFSISFGKITEKYFAISFLIKFKCPLTDKLSCNISKLIVEHEIKEIIANAFPKRSKYYCLV